MPLYKPNQIILESHMESQWDGIIEALNGCKFWAYIFHENEPYIATDKKVLDGLAKVGDIKPKHLHVCVIDSPRTLKSWANLFDLPINFIEPMKAGRKNNLLYLTHESPKAIREGKLKYERSQVVTSNPVKYQEYISSGDIPNYHVELNDLLSYQQGKISLQDFLYKHPELLAVTPYQRINLYKNLLSLKKY